MKHRVIRSAPGFVWDANGTRVCAVLPTHLIYSCGYRNSLTLPAGFQHHVMTPPDLILTPALIAFPKSGFSCLPFNVTHGSRGNVYLPNATFSVRVIYSLYLSAKRKPPLAPGLITYSNTVAPALSSSQCD